MQSQQRPTGRHIVGLLKQTALLLVRQHAGKRLEPVGVLFARAKLAQNVDLGGHIAADEAENAAHQREELVQFHIAVQIQVRVYVVRAVGHAALEAVQHQRQVKAIGSGGWFAHFVWLLISCGLC